MELLAQHALKGRGLRTGNSGMYGLASLAIGLTLGFDSSASTCVRLCTCRPSKLTLENHNGSEGVGIDVLLVCRGSR